MLRFKFFMFVKIYLQFKRKNYQIKDILTKKKPTLLFSIFGNLLKKCQLRLRLFSKIVQ